MAIVETKRAVLRIALAALVTGMVGCETTYKEDPKLVQKYSAPPAPTATATDVYVIRGSNFYGGGRGAWIAANDKVVADLSNGSHVLLHLNSGINTVHGVQALAGFGFAAVDNRPGETVFLALDYAKGKMAEVSRDLGISMVMKTKQVEPLKEVRPNTGYDDALVNIGMFDLGIMSKGGEKLTADSNSAVITFVRAGTLLKDFAFSIWDETGFVGDIPNDSYFQVRVTPGRHAYIAKSEHFAVLNADVEAGKNYLVQLEVNMGWNQAHIKLLPLSAKDAAATQIKKVLTDAHLYSVKQEVLNTPSVRARIDSGNQYLQDARKKIAEGSLPARDLKADENI